MGKSEGRANEAATQRNPGRLPRLWFLWLVFVAGANFLLGLLVGRGTSPLHFDIQALQKEIAALRETETRSEVERFRESMNGQGREQPLNFYDFLKPDDKPPPVPKPVPKTVAGQTPTPAPQDAPPAPRAPPPEPAALETSQARGPSVQVAAMREAEAARSMVRHLIAKGFPAHSVRTETDDRGIWYRVRIGPLADRQAAEEMIERLSRSDYEAIVVEPPEPGRP